VTRSPYVPLGVAVLFVSLGSILVRLAQAPALVVAFYRIGLASVLLLPFASGAARHSWPALSSRARLLLVGCGAALALHFATWITSLSYTSVAASVLLVNLAPVFNVVLSRTFLGERPSAAVLASIGLAILGAVLIAVGDWATGPRPFAGDALAIVGAVSLSIYHVIGRGLRSALPLEAYLLGVWGTAAVTLGLTALASGAPLLGHPTRTWAAFAALALGPTLLGHGLVNRSLRLLPAPVVSLFLLGEPLGASGLAYVLWHEVPGVWTLAGGLVILVALAAVVIAGTR
jgi:drug/metabolite transporter (DMT)-like permease